MAQTSAKVWHINFSEVGTNKFFLKKTGYIHPSSHIALHQNKHNSECIFEFCRCCQKYYPVPWSTAMWKVWQSSRREEFPHAIFSRGIPWWPWCSGSSKIGHGWFWCYHAVNSEVYRSKCVGNSSVCNRLKTFSFSMF